MFMILEMAALVLASCDPRLAALFTPRHPQLGRYEVCVTAQPIETAAGPSATIETLDPLDAFGAHGDYDPSRLARLYAGTRTRVARTWQMDGDRFESVTYISPYPDASLGRLESGTMEIRWILVK
jgi:hypothetical protein